MPKNQPRRPAIFLIAGLLACACSAGNADAAQAKSSARLATGIEMAYIEMGKPGGDPVLFLHGYTDSTLSFLGTAKALESIAGDLDIFVLDQRGHGDSSMPTGTDCPSAPQLCFTPEAMARDVLAFMDDRNIATAHIVGHSMGSLVAQELALRWPARIDSVVLIGTTADTTRNAAVHDFLAPEIEERWKVAFSAQGRRWPEDAYLRAPGEAIVGASEWIAAQWAVEPGVDQAFLDETAGIAANTPIGTWIGVLRNLYAFSNRERLQQLQVPALVLSAFHDPAFPAQDQAVVRESLGAAAAAGGIRVAFKSYGDAAAVGPGHNMQWAAPSTVAADIAAWLEGEAREIPLPAIGAIVGRPWNSPSTSCWRPTAGASQAPWTGWCRWSTKTSAGWRAGRCTSGRT